MAALARTGNAAEATRVYQTLCSRLQDELGVEPSAETQAHVRGASWQPRGRVRAGARRAHVHVHRHLRQHGARRGDRRRRLAEPGRLARPHASALCSRSTAGRRSTTRATGSSSRSTRRGRRSPARRRVQRRLAEHRRESGFAPDVRIGIHSSPASQAGGKYRGKGVARGGADRRARQRRARSSRAATPSPGCRRSSGSTAAAPSSRACASRSTWSRSAGRRWPSSSPAPRRCSSPPQRSRSAWGSAGSPTRRSPRSSCRSSRSGLPAAPRR